MSSWPGGALPRGAFDARRGQLHANALLGVACRSD
jgi:hypothetical protein